MQIEVVEEEVEWADVNISFSLYVEIYFVNSVWKEKKTEKNN